MGLELKLAHRIAYLNRHSISRMFIVALYPPPKEKLGKLERHYRYKLEDCRIPPPQSDPVMRLMIKTIREFNKEDMYFATMNIRVWNPIDGPPLWPLDLANARCPVKLYAFKEQDQEFPRTVPVAIDKRGSYHLTIDQILVQIQGEWKPLKAWLISLPARDAGINKRLGAQRMWWKLNGKIFPLMKLPWELRLLIFEHALGTKIFPQTKYSERNDHSMVTFGYGDPRVSTYGRSNSILITDTRPFSPTPPNYGILGVSKQVRCEALQAGWEGSREYFARELTFTTVVSCQMPPVGYNWLSRIELDFELLDYLHLFGIVRDTQIYFDPAGSKGPLLQNITSLRELYLRFRHP